MSMMALEVTPNDIDRLGHVNNAVYLRWIERAVHEDWLARADAAERAALDWIAVRHEIDYRLPAFCGDRLVVELRLESVRRARAWFRSTVPGTARRSWRRCVLVLH